MPTCECELCLRHRHVNETIESRDVERLIELVRKLEENLEHVEMDSEVDREILKGHWPSATYVLSAALARAIVHKAERKWAKPTLWSRG